MAHFVYICTRKNLKIPFYEHFNNQIVSQRIETDPAHPKRCAFFLRHDNKTQFLPTI